MACTLYGYFLWVCIKYNRLYEDWEKKELGLEDEEDKEPLMDDPPKEDEQMGNE